MVAVFRIFFGGDAKRVCRSVGNKSDEMEKIMEESRIYIYRVQYKWVTEYMLTVQMSTNRHEQLAACIQKVGILLSNTF